MAKFLPANCVNETTGHPKGYPQPMLPTMPIPVEAIQSAEVTSPTPGNAVVVGSNPCAVPIATLSIKDLRLRGSSFIRSHASKHGLPNASRKLMKEVIDLLKTHYALVHQVTMLEDDFGDSGGAVGVVGGKVVRKRSLPKNVSSPTMLPQRPVSLIPLQVHHQMHPEHTLLSQVASMVDRLPPRSPMIQQDLQHQHPNMGQPQQHHHHHHQPAMFHMDGGQSNGVVGSCSAKILARTRGELNAFGTSLLRPEAAAHKVHNSSRKPKHVVIDELWRHYIQCHARDLMASSSDGCIGNVMDDEDDK